MKQEMWFWPSSEEVNDFPDPVAFDAEWKGWKADLAESPSTCAEIFSREYVQNSWDTIQAESGKVGKASAASKGRIDFSFIELEGTRAQKFVESFGINEFADRYSSMTEKNRKDARLVESELIKTKNTKKIRILVCSESGGGGMWGHWFTGGIAAKESSRLRFALIQTATEKAGEGSGGSWGHGKKAIANASKCRVIAVYTCHEPRSGNDDKDGVSRRFLGVAYWKRHQANGYEHVGLGVLGNLGQGSGAKWRSFEPLENEQADDFVNGLEVPQISVRSPEIAGQRGSTYIIIEPAFEPEDLKFALERNWWPLIIQHKLPMTISGYDGEQLPIEPEKRQELTPFVDAFRAATGSGSPSAQAQVVKVDGTEVGNLAVIADVSEDGFSYRSDIPENTSLVALVRNDMVIAYQPFPKKIAGKPPFVRGALNVDRDRNAKASDLLKMAEPHLHNEWRTEADGATAAQDAKFAKAVIERVNRRVKEVRDEYSKPSAFKDLHFDVFAEMFAGPDSVSRRPDLVDPPSPRDFKIHDLSQSNLEVDGHDPTKIRFSSLANISLSAKAMHELNAAELDQVRVRVTLGWKVLEDGEGGTIDHSLADHLSCVWPSGFQEVAPGIAEGPMWDEVLAFRWRSAYFSDDWQVLPFAKAELIDAAVGGAS